MLDDSKSRRRAGAAALHPSVIKLNEYETSTFLLILDSSMGRGEVHD